MRALIIHQEAEYFAGAETMLAYFLEGLVASESHVTVAAVQPSRIPEVIPKGVGTCWLPANSRFSPLTYLKQAAQVRRLAARQPFDVIHGWAARDWELTALASRLIGRPAVGTLHDHPRAPFISKARQRLMAWAARLGLRQVVCVSDAVRCACLEAGYPPWRLCVVRNGLPWRTPPAAAPPKPSAFFRLGYLGQFSERKGLRGLFEILQHLWNQQVQNWELDLAGDAQDAQGKRLVQQIQNQFATCPWWPRVRFLGWVKQPAAFLGSLDLLICPSAEFDPFPTVLLEAGQASLPVLASRVGGVPEIIEHEVTGWLFEPGDWSKAAVELRCIIETPDMAPQAGLNARKRVELHFSATRMVDEYLSVYRTVSGLPARSDSHS